MATRACRTLRVTATLSAFVFVWLGGIVCLSGCASDEPGYSKTTTKTTVDTPTEKTTTTETHEKETKINR